LNTTLFNDATANNWLFPGYDPIHFLGPALNLSILAAYNYFKEKLAFFTNLGVKGYKIDRGEEGEMPGKPFILTTLAYAPL
jgi:alpha-D-xyloside xylohydrolase